MFSNYENEFSLKILAGLNDCKDHFEWRNELVHGRIYSPEYHAHNLKSGRPNVPDRRATSQELYLLANNLEVLTQNLLWPLALPRFISEALSKKA